MKIHQEISWQLDQQPQLAQLEKRLLTAFQTLTEEHWQQRHLCLLDTFDWTLWRKGEALVFSHNAGQAGKKGRLQVFSLQGGSPLLTSEPLATPPNYFWQLGSDPLTEHLRKRLGFWSLQPWVGLEEESWLLACRDEEGKIQVRIQVLQQQVFRLDCEQAPRQHRLMLILTPLRGYEREAGAAYQCLQELLGEPKNSMDPLAWVEACGLAPEAAWLPNPLPLNPESPAEEVLRLAAGKIFAQARRYEQGIQDDINTEYLHQYRVNLRRLRSLFTLLKQAFPSKDYQALKAQLQPLSKMTTRLRDLDVFLLAKDHFIKQVPEVFRSGLQAFFLQVTQERNQVQQHLASELSTRDYQQSCQRLSDFFAQPASLATKKGRQPVARLAGQKIRQRYNKITAASQAIDASSPDEALHDLRLEFKKLRYLLDFFAALNPEQSIKKQLKSLKKLQKVLGEFNDLSVQQQFLLEYLEQTKAAEQKAALHGLITLLHHQQLQMKLTALQLLADFNRAGQNNKGD